MERVLRNPILAALIALGFLILLASTVSIVPETQQAVVVRFGQPVRIINSYDPIDEAGRALIDVTTNAPLRYNKHSLVNNWFIVQ